MYALDDTLEQILGQRYGNGINAMYHCPFHEDRTPSLSAHREEGVWLCHQCGEKGSIEWLAKLTGETLDPSFIWDRAIRSVREVPPVEHNFAPLANSLYNQGLSGAGDRAIRDYISSRGVSVDTRHHFWLGWDGSRISFPYWHDDARKLGTVHAIKYRALDGSKSSESGSKRSLYNVEDIRGAGSVIIAEGESDTLLLWSSLHGTPFRVCGVPGASVSKSQWEIWALDFLFAQDIIVLFDADEAGDKGAATAIEVLGEKARRIRPAEGLDVTDHYLKYGELPGARELFD